jgi:SOS-response transcriptional repressor LexA/DNA-binding XRE family transcriptional regulator
MALGKNIEYLRTLMGMKRPDVARGIGVDNDQAIYAIESRDSRRSEFAPELARFFGVPLDALLEENLVGMPLAEIKALGDAPARPAKFDANVTRAPVARRAIPVISAIQAGKLKEIMDPYPPGEGIEIIYTDDDDLSRWTFGLIIEGDSMMPEFRPGDRVIIDPEVDPRPGDFVAAKNGEEEATFKKYRPRGMDSAGNMIFELSPLNDDYPVMRSDVQPLCIIGVMIEHRKKYRRR